MCKNEVNSKVHGWSEALVDAERQFKKAKKSGLKHQLSEAIAIIKRKIEAGEPWPGASNSVISEG